MEISIPTSDIEFFLQCFFIGFFSWPAFWWLVSAIFEKACHSIDEATKSSLHYLKEDD